MASKKAAGTRKPTPLATVESGGPIGEPPAAPATEQEAPLPAVTTEGAEGPRLEDLRFLLQEMLDRHQAGQRDDAVAVQQSLRHIEAETGALQRRLDALRGEVELAVSSDDVMALIAAADAPEYSDLQRRARAVHVELTLRRQEVALAEWRRKLAAAEQEAERQRQLFARLEADFERRSAEAARERAAVHDTEAELRDLLAEREAALAAASEARHALERDLAALEQRGQEAARQQLELELEFERTDSELRAARAQGEAAEQRAGGLARELAEATTANRQTILTLEQYIARLREENAELSERLTLRASVLTETERRVEELRSSRWRKIGLGLGLAKRASFEQ